MPKIYPDVTQSGAASAEVQEKERKPTTPASPRLAPQLLPNSNTNFGIASLDLFCFPPRRGLSFEGKHSSFGEVIVLLK
jgi:hypothetical protein